MRRLVVLLALVLVGACADGEPGHTTASTAEPTVTTMAAASGCGSVVAEQLDPNSGRHVLTDDESGVAWLSDPPTSGPHRPIGDRTTFDEPLSRSVQVAVLERGDVLIQVADEARRADVTPGDPAHVVVALHPALPAPIVATAWTHKMLCETPDLEALRAFTEAYAGKGPGGH